MTTCAHQEYDRLQRHQALEAFDRLSLDLGREIERRGIHEEQLLQDLKQDRQEAFREQYGDPSE